VKKIADTGLLVAAADAKDRDHAWAATALRTHAPFHTCEAVVLETAWVLGSLVRSGQDGSRARQQSRRVALRAQSR
jgi:predicted nucleic acid-binding protein